MAGGRPASAGRLRLAAAVLVAGLLAVGVVWAVAGGGADRPEEPSLRALSVEHCRGFAEDDARACFEREFLAMVEGVPDPRPAVARITEAARDAGGVLLENCHVVMHTVGRTYAVESEVSLGSLMEFLPADNDPGCPAGFAHGLVTGVAPSIDVSAPGEAVSACDGAGTRFQRYSCVHGFGHAFMRLYEDQLEPALKLCTALGSSVAPDCAQGAYHDYWFAVVGADDAFVSGDVVRDPRELCGAQPDQYVRPCWYRAFLETGFSVSSAFDIRDLCSGLDGVQRSGCVTAASVIGPADPFEQMRLCSRLGARDAADCVRGVKVANLEGAPVDRYVALISRCESAACFEWLGKALAVVTDGAFACSRLSGAAARQCEAGAARMDEALETFS